MVPLVILNAEPVGYSESARVALRRLGSVVEGPLTRQDLLDRARDCHVLIVRLGHRVDAEVLKTADHLLAVVSATTGLDHIDLEEAKKKGIAILSLRGEAEFLRTVDATPEHTWALLLALVRRIPWAFADVQKGQWDRDAFRGAELHGKRLGIVGVGRVGKRVADYGVAFGMDVAGYDPSVGKWPEHVRRVSELSELCEDSDVLSVHVPLEESTRGLIGQAQFDLLPPGAILLNTSRGGIVNESALLAALTTGALAGAALDVVEGEREPERLSRHPLIEYAREHDNLLITPHVAGATVKSMAKTEEFMVRKLERFLEGNPRRFSRE